MQPALRPPVPSTRLLRFLRSQTESPHFFSSNRHHVGSSLGPTAPARRALRVLCPSSRKPAKPGNGDARWLSTTSPWSDEEVLRASLFDVESIVTRVVQQRQRRNGPGGARSSAGLFFSTTGGARRERCPDDPDGKPRKSWWQERFWRTATGRGAEPLKPDDLPLGEELVEDSIFNLRRNAKAPLDTRLRCTEVDENGQVILVDGEFKKTELIAKYGLLPRDLRKIDSSNLPHILVRPSAILLNLLHLKVLIKRDRVLLFDVYGSQTSYPQSAFMYDLQGRLQQKTPQASGGLPYEFRALEAVLTSVTSELEADFEAVRDPVIRILSELEDDIDRHKLRILLILSKRVSTFERKAKLVRDAIEELLDADDDLAAMYLTEKGHDLYRGLDDHTEVELLLESYHKLCDEVVQEAQNLVTSIRNTEEIVRAILDANRNALMLLDLKFSIGTLGLAMGTFLAGLYGMNLENFIEETNWGFGTVTSISAIFSGLVCWYGLVKLRRVQRVRMMGDEKGSLARNRHWFQDDGPLALLEARNREKLRRIQNMQKAVVPKRKWLG